MNRQHNRLILDVAQVLAWACAMLLPAAVTWLISGDSNRLGMTFWPSFYMMLPICLVYLVNYFLLVPGMLFRKRIVWFIVINVLLLALLNAPSLFPRGEIPEPIREHLHRRDILAFRIPTLITAAFFQLVFIFLAIGVFLAIGIFLAVRIFLVVGIFFLRISLFGILNVLVVVFLLLVLLAGAFGVFVFLLHYHLCSGVIHLGCPELGSRVQNHHRRQ